MKGLITLGSTILLAGLVGCGSSSGGSSSGDSSSSGNSISGVSSSESSPDSDAAIKAFVRETNKPHYGSTFDARFTQEELDNWDGVTEVAFVDLDTSMVRFGINTQIPIYYVSADGSNPPQDIIDGVAKIEASLGDVFTDFTLVTADLSAYKDVNYPDENRGIYVNNVPDEQFDITEFNTRFGTSIDYGIVYAQDTGFYSSESSSNPQNMCANASTGPYHSLLAVDIHPETGEYRSDSVLWVNMGNGQCDWDADMVTHETAHAMGMVNHINNYFGLWTDTAMNILSTMYNNPAGTAFENIEVHYRDNAVVY